MPDPSPHRVLDQALRDMAPTRTRRSLLERAAAGAAGVAAAGTLGPVAGAAARPSPTSIRAFGEVAVTTEAFTVTLLTELLRRVSHHPEVPAGVKAVFEGAYAAEVDHFRFTRKFWRPTTTRFWVPDGAFGGAGDALSLESVGKTLLAGETLFVDLYLIGVTTFAHARRATFARYCGELAGVESEHRVLARSLLELTPPNDVGFEEYLITSPGGVIQALQSAGIGFGARGATPGRFYALPHPIMPPPLKIRSNRPR